MDETPIKVLDKDKKGVAHQGYYWVYHAPLDGAVLFDYSPTRGSSAPLPILGNFREYFQTDGYAVYEQHGKKKEITHLACWAHARREFERALNNDKAGAEKALLLIQHLYDGNLQIDNNLCVNAIRPVALGRKNYLFAGSDEAAQRSAMVYSFFAICKKHEVNPFQWLKYTLENIMSINHKKLKDLYPQNYKKIVQKSNL